MVEIPLGRFFPADSIIHKLSPVVKTISFVALAVGSLFLSGIVDSLILFSFWISLLLLSKVPLGEYIKTLWTIKFLLLLIVIFQLFFTHGKVLLDMKILRITEEGLLNATLLTVRMVFAVFFSITLSYTTTPMEISSSIEAIVGKLPMKTKRVSELGMALSLTLTFIPLLSLQTNRIIMAQKARGVEFNGGSFFKRVRNSLSVVIPVITTSLKKAQDTASALEIMGYEPGYTLGSLDKMSWSINDSIILISTAVSITAVVIL
ncbi:MAG: energy-coupling factor transporter transmembrane protein EcfT [Thermotogae bacterium]|nr:energy-coupling factor transporter transmembrane protein EcfT [Thermotogota bacterium]